MIMLQTNTACLPSEAESPKPLPALAHPKLIRTCAGLNWAVGSPATQFRCSNDTETVVTRLIPARLFIPPKAVCGFSLAERGGRRVA